MSASPTTDSTTDTSSSPAAGSTADPGTNADPGTVAGSGAGGYDAPHGLHEFVLSLLTDVHARAAFELDARGALHGAGLGGLTPGDVTDLLPLVADDIAGHRVPALHADAAVAATVAGVGLCDVSGDLGATLDAVALDGIGASVDATALGDITATADATVDLTAVTDGLATTVHGVGPGPGAVTASLDTGVDVDADIDVAATVDIAAVDLTAVTSGLATTVHGVGPDNVTGHLGLQADAHAATDGHLPGLTGGLL